MAADIAADHSEADTVDVHSAEAAVAASAAAAAVLLLAAALAADHPTGLTAADLPIVALPMAVLPMAVLPMAVLPIVALPMAVLCHPRLRVRYITIADVYTAETEQAEAWDAGQPQLSLSL